RGSSARVEPKELNAVEIAAEREPRNAVLDQHGGIDGVPGILARLLDVRADHPTVVNEALRIFGTRAHGVSDARAIAAVRRGGVVEVSAVAEGDGVWGPEIGRFGDLLGDPCRDLRERTADVAPGHEIVRELHGDIRARGERDPAVLGAEDRW